MKWPFRSTMSAVLLAICAFSVLPMAAQEGPLENIPPKGVTPEEIITHFAAKEKLFKEARDQYTFRQDIKVQTRDGDTVSGEYPEGFDVLYDANAKPTAHLPFPPPTSPR